MDHRRTSIQFLRATGLIPVKIRPHEKVAFTEWDPRRAGAEDHSLTLVRIEQDHELNLAALFSGRYADIDVDTSDPALIAALDSFLPRTAYVWGRGSKPRSHRAYALHEDFDRAPWGKILKFCKDLRFGDESYSIEVRGGKPENGLYSVLPGSIHPSGEAYEWDSEIDPTMSGAYVALDTIVSGVRLAQAVAILAPYFIEGLRNDLSLALAGLLWRIRATSYAAYGIDSEADHAEGGLFLLTENLAKRLFEIVLEVAGDDPADKRSRMLNFKNTWEKLDRDPQAKVTGGKAFAEQMGDEGVAKIRAVYRLLSDSDALEAIEAIIEQFVVWYGQGVCVDLHMVEKGIAQPWMTKDQTINSLGGRKLSMGDKKIPIANLIFGSSIIRRVAGLTFDPSTQEMMVDTPHGVKINQWRGFGVEPCPQMVLDEEIEPYLDYVKNVLGCGFPERAEWIHAWTADMLQRPHEKPGTALVLVGPQGAGKTFLGEQVIGKIIGSGHYVQMNSIESLTSKFNSIADNKLFIQCDEAMHSYQKDVASKLKSIITDESVTIEPKGINSYKKPNHMHFLFTSNEEHSALFIDPSPHERRYTVLKVNPIRSLDTEYWVRMRNWVPANLHKILRWLLDHKYDRELVLRPIQTAAKRDIQRVSVDMEVAWIVARIKQGFPLDRRAHTQWFQAHHTEHIDDKDKRENTLRRDVWPNRVTSQAIEEDFKSFSRAQGRAVWTGNIITSLMRALPDGSLTDAERINVSFFTQNGQVRERVRLVSFPPPDKIVEHLRVKYGDIIDYNFHLDTGEPAAGEEPEDEELEY